MLLGKKVIIITMGNRNRDSEKGYSSREGTKGKEVKSASRRWPLDVIRMTNGRTNEQGSEHVNNVMKTFDEILQEVKNKLDASSLPEELKNTFAKKFDSLKKDFQEYSDPAVHNNGKDRGKGRKDRDLGEASIKDPHGKLQKMEKMNKALDMWNDAHKQYEQFITTLKEIAGKIKDSHLLEEPNNAFVETTHSSITEFTGSSDQAICGSSLANDEMKNKLLTYKLDMAEFHWEISRSLGKEDFATAEKWAKKLTSTGEAFKSYLEKQRLLDEMKDPSQSHILHGEREESSTTREANNEFYNHEVHNITNAHNNDTTIDSSGLTDNEQYMYKQIKNCQDSIEVDPFGKNAFNLRQEIFGRSTQLFDSLNNSLNSLTQQKDSEQHKNMLMLMDEMYKNIESHFRGKSIYLKSNENELKSLKLFLQEITIKFILDHTKGQDLQDLQKELQEKAHDKIKEWRNKIEEWDNQVTEQEKMLKELNKAKIDEYKWEMMAMERPDLAEVRMYEKVVMPSFMERMEWQELKDEAKKLIKGYDPRKLKGKLLRELLGGEEIDQRLEKLKNNINGSEYRKLRKLLQGKDKPAQHTFKQLLAMLRKNKQLTMLDEELQKIEKEEYFITEERFELEKQKENELEFRKTQIEEYKKRLDTK